MGDYTDWTDSIELLGSEIQLPIDLQGAYIQLPVDIQGQYINLSCDIVAQSIGNIAIDIASQSIGNINVNISSQSATLNVNISSQSANVTISISAQNVGVYLQPEWSARQGTDINIVGSAQTTLYNGANVIDWTVPEGHECYINQFGGIWYLLTPTVSLGGRVALSIWGGELIAPISGVNGVAFALTKPIKVTAGQRIIVTVLGYSSDQGTLIGFFSGYLT